MYIEICSSFGVLLRWLDIDHSSFFCFVYGSKARSNSLVARNHEISLHEINTLDWDELLVEADMTNQSSPTEGTYIT